MYDVSGFGDNTEIVEEILHMNGQAEIVALEMEKIEVGGKSESHKKTLTVVNSEGKTESLPITIEYVRQDEHKYSVTITGLTGKDVSISGELTVYSDNYGGFMPSIVDIMTTNDKDGSLLFTTTNGVLLPR